MPSSEIYTAMQPGVLDAANTSSGSFVSYRLYEQVKCLTEPGDHALWFMYEPILLSQSRRAALSPAQQKPPTPATHEDGDYTTEQPTRAAQKPVDGFTEDDREA